MLLFSDPQGLQKAALDARAHGKRIALIPTMGNLHEGHLSLVRTGMEQADIVIVSIFVNPIQFAPNEDFAAYPRTFEEDRAKLEQTVGTRCELWIFHPAPEALYAPDASVYVEENTLSKVLCGVTRPIHFRGVCTVVNKLFNLAQPNVAVFGQKDAQQALIIQRMVRDLNIPVEIIVAPIVRGPDGLALSSRNAYLSEKEHQNALVLSRELLKLKNDPPFDLLGARASIANAIMENGGHIDYIETRYARTLEPTDRLDQPTLFALAVYFGKTRLIDNVLLQPAPLHRS